MLILRNSNNEYIKDEWDQLFLFHDTQAFRIMNDKICKKISRNIRYSIMFNFVSQS